MNRIILKISISIICLFSSLLSFSQNVTINYQTWSSSSGCDIFNTATNVPATINGSSGNIQHVTMLGDVKYIASSLNAVQLDNNYVNPSSIKGTKYRLAYNFKANYRYIITVTASELNSTATSGDNPVLRLDLSNSTITGGSAYRNGNGKS